MKQRWDVWGWYSVLMELAEEISFHRSGLTGIESVQDSNFYDAFYFLGKTIHYNSIG